MGVIQLGLRGFQFLCAAVVLGISISLARSQIWGSVPFATGFSAAAGASGIIAALFGTIAHFFDAIPDLYPLGLDIFASLVFLVGFIIDAVKVAGVSCTNYNQYGWNDVVNGGYGNASKDNQPKASHEWKSYKSDPKGWMSRRCVSFKADTAFMCLGFLACVALVIASAGALNKFRRVGRF